MKPLLTPPDGNTKIGKNPIPTWSLNLAPAKTSGLSKNMCPFSTPQCRATCLDTAGRNVMPHAEAARAWRTALFVHSPAIFKAQLRNELRKLPDGSGVRLNALSDIRWELHWEQVGLDNLQYYDYTKNPKRIAAKRRHWLAPNYDLTFSVGEGTSVKEAIYMVRRRTRTPLRIAMVVHRDSTLWSYVDGDRWIDGDQSDWRPGDPPSSIVLLRPKGRAAQLTPDDRGFVKP